MKNDLEAFLDILEIRVEKIFYDEASKNLQFYSNCVEITHNAAKKDGLIDGNVIEIPKLNMLKKAFAIFTSLENGFREMTKDRKEEYFLITSIACFYYGINCAFKYLEGTADDNEYAEYIKTIDIKMTEYLLSNKYNIDIKKYIKYVSSLVESELIKYENFNAINFYNALAAFFQFGVTLALYEK